MNLTEKDCYEFLEKQCRIVCYSKVEEDELKFFRANIISALEELAKCRKRKQERLEERRQKKMIESYCPHLKNGGVK